MAEGFSKPFPWATRWIVAEFGHLGVDAAVSLFPRNYDLLRSSAG